MSSYERQHAFKVCANALQNREASALNVKEEQICYDFLMNLSLSGDDERLRERREDLFPGAVVLRRSALAKDMALLAALDDVLAVSPFRESFTPGGQKMSVRITGLRRIWCRRGVR